MAVDSGSVEQAQHICELDTAEMQVADMADTARCYVQGVLVMVRM